MNEKYFEREMTHKLWRKDEVFLRKKQTDAIKKAVKNRKGT